jgi:dihydroorotase
MTAFDLVLAGGRIVDPSQSIDAVLDIGFTNGKVSEIGHGLAKGAAQVRNLRGLIITPGLIDLHTHVYWGGTSLGIDAAMFCRKSAVTTAVDTGSAGAGNFAGFRAHVIDRSPVRILAYLHISHAGIFGFSRDVHFGESETIRLMDPRGAVRVVESNRDCIVGIKVRVGRHASGTMGILPLEAALEAAEQTGLPLMAHIDEPPPTYAEVVDRLRPGDVLTHAFRPFPNAPCNADGSVREAVLKARARGVLFDIGHGMGSFAFKTARAMLARGFEPDTISSDVHALCIDGPAHDLVTTMSKFLCLGMDFAAILKATTTASAQAVGRPELGTLKPGAPADASVLAIDGGRFEYLDVEGESMIGDRRITARGAVVSGTWWDPLQEGGNRAGRVEDGSASSLAS